MEEVKCCTNLLEDDTKVVNHWTGEELQSHQQAFRCWFFEWQISSNEN